MRAILLAAGAQQQESERPWVLQPLGDRAMIDYVVDLARPFVDPTEMVIVVSANDNAVVAHLGNAFCYEEQSVPQGTGHAVLQARRALGDYAGPVLILYGDTALLNHASLLGLLTRHQLKRAGLTLLTARSDQNLPYGRIVRDAQGRILDIVEAVEATAHERTIKELNVGAYVAETPALWDALERLAGGQPGANVPLTACVRPILRAGFGVESYQILDEDELLGINSAENLAEATFILQKRQLQPRRESEQNVIRFGTGGWRALIGEAFTLDNVRRLCQSLANEIIRQNREAAGVIIGYDRRFLSDTAAEVAAEVFAGNNIGVKFQRGDTPTPLITYATAKEQAAYGLIFTASHNPPQWNGLKVFATDGSLPLDEEYNGPQ